MKNSALLTPQARDCQALRQMTLKLRPSAQAILAASAESSRCEWRANCHFGDTMNSTYECLSCKECARLLARYEALKREQARIQGGLGEGASEAGEIVARVAESRRAYTQHWAIHREAQIYTSCAVV